jgi:hypothetical protein
MLIITNLQNGKNFTTPQKKSIYQIFIKGKPKRNLQSLSRLSIHYTYSLKLIEAHFREAGITEGCNNKKVFNVVSAFLNTRFFL